MAVAVAAELGGRLWQRPGARACDGVAALRARGGRRPEGGRRGRKRQRWLHGPGALRDSALGSARRPNNEAPEADLGQPQW